MSFRVARIIYFHSQVSVSFHRARFSVLVIRVDVRVAECSVQFYVEITSTDNSTFHFYFGDEENVLCCFLSSGKDERNGLICF